LPERFFRFGSDGYSYRDEHLLGLYWAVWSALSLLWGYELQRHATGQPDTNPAAETIIGGAILAMLMGLPGILALGAIDSLSALARKRRRLTWRTWITWVLVSGTLCGIYADSVNWFADFLYPRSLETSSWWNMGWIAITLTIGVAGALASTTQALASHTIAGRLVYVRLRKEGAVPIEPDAFLAWASERAILRPVGDEYLFVHAMLLERLANRE
jgi:hypothetical protein